MISRIQSGAVLGIDGYRVEVEVSLAPGIPGMSIVGLPDTAVKESMDRVQAAIRNTRLEVPLKRITVNLAPASIKKEGSAFDLPIALGILAADGLVKPDRLAGTMILGELSLDGRIKPVRGALCLAACARAEGLESVLLPEANAAEAAWVEGIRIYPVENLPQALAFLNGEGEIDAHGARSADDFLRFGKYDMDFQDVKGQHHVKRALEVAAAGGHNVLLIGSPGSGKSMLAKRLATILPKPTLDEAIETTKVHSILGLLDHGPGLVAIRPFRAPHHTISDAGLIGGGRTPMPGEVAIAHNGVLFLDELPEFRRNVLEVLRQPLEDFQVRIARAAGSIQFPTRFILVGAMNPCPCGYRSDPKRVCHCNPLQIRKYVSKISGPLLDRIDLHVEVPSLDYQELSSDFSGEPSAQIRERVEQAWRVQCNRLPESRFFCNAALVPRQLKTLCQLDAASKGLMQQAMERLGLSARAHDRILKVARTIADLTGEEKIQAAHLAEAIQYRSLDRESWF